MRVNLSPRGRLVAFFALSFVLGWILYVPAIGGPDGSNIPISPVVAAFLVLALTGGRPALRDWLARCLRWRTSPGWYVLAIGFSWVALPLAAVAAVSLGAARPSDANLANWVLVPVGFLVMFVLVGIGEEWGWTGFALPELQALGPWAQQVGILAVLRTLWHLPLLLTGDLLWPIFLVIIGAQYLWATAYRRSGLVMIVAVWHASLNSVGGDFLSPLFTGPDAMTFAVLWVGAYVALIAVMLYLDREALRRGTPEPVAA